MRVLGYNGGIEGYPAKFDTSHDASATLVVDGEVVAACEEERFSREKHSGKFPQAAIDYCLREAGLRSASELDLVTYFHSWPLWYRRESYRQNSHALNLVGKVGLYGTLAVMRRYNRLADYSDAHTQRTFERSTGVSLRPGQFACVPHHLCHAASAFYDSPFDRALCFTVDAQGESSSSMTVVAKGTDLRVIGETYAPNSLGYLYAFVTKYLGFEQHDEYKIMGLAPYGTAAHYRAFFERSVTLHSDGGFEVDPQMISHLMVRDAVLAPGRGYPKRFDHLLGPARLPGEPVLQKHMDIAAALQESLERTVLHRLEHLRRATGESNLCMAGGVALNSTMNGKIARSGLFDNVWVHAAAHDAGTSYGAALYGYHNLLRKPRHFPKRKDRYLGPAHPPSAITDALREFERQITYERDGNGKGTVVDEVARAIAAGKVVGWYQGRMEWGPRALGNRSILADPRRDDMKDIVNHAVKLREGFRPFAPSCLAERASEWFDMKGLPDSPFMLFVVPVHPDQRERIPAVTHIDGSARVQTVTQEENPKYHALISAFEKLTGVPVLLNTSFNVKGEAIVNTPHDAVRCFLNTQIDLLVLDDVIVEKRPEVAAILSAKRARKASESGRVIDGQISAV